VARKAKASQSVGRRASEGQYLKFRTRWRHVLLIDERGRIAASARKLDKETEAFLKRKRAVGTRAAER